VAEVAWCGSGQLAGRVPSGFFQPVQDHLATMLNA
jgi:hypothetical protein